MKYLKYSFLILIVGIVFSYRFTTNAYLFGLKSADNTVENIQTIEANYNISVPLVSFIFDPRDTWIIDLLNKLPSTLGTNRIYHITLSPNNFSAQEVSSGAFDQEYRLFFQTIKKNNLRVVFRTMHEMNGGRYPRASNPETFKSAWIHVWKLSREEKLGTENILFDFSVNHRDMPTKGTPSQTAKLIPCQLRNKDRLGCYTFEDYYPGSGYVDLVGFTFYNRGKGNSDRKRLTPNDIVYEKGWNPLTRIKQFKKPIMIDEVGTTAVWYTDNYNIKTSREKYKKDYQKKNTRLWQLKQLLLANDDIVGIVYFNVDYTNGLSQRLIGEADRSVINTTNNKVYNTIFSLFKDNEPLHQRSKLTNLFGIGLLTINNKSEFIPTEYIKSTRDLWKEINRVYTGNSQKTQAINKLSDQNKYMKLFLQNTK